MIWFDFYGIVYINKYNIFPVKRIDLKVYRVRSPDIVVLPAPIEITRPAICQQQQKNYSHFLIRVLNWSGMVNPSAVRQATTSETNISKLTS